MIYLLRYPEIFPPFDVGLQRLLVNHITEAVALKKAVRIPTNVDPM